MKTSSLGLAFFLLLLGCDTKEQCVADCNGAETDDPSDTADPGDETGAPSLACGELEAEADAFIAANNACETVLDCVMVDAICYGGEGRGPCGTSAISATADRDAWDALQEEMAGECQCGADACGPTVICNAEQQCEVVFGDPGYCESIQQDVQTFLDANRACEVNEDCAAFNSSCFVDECSVVGLRADTNPDDWTQLDTLLGGCEVESGFDGEYCNYVGECGPTIVCGDDGMCTAQFP